jgi:hypothetical protein
MSHTWASRTFVNVKWFRTKPSRGVIDRRSSLDRRNGGNRQAPNYVWQGVDINASLSACPAPLIYVERRVLDAILANLADWIWSAPLTEKYVTLGTPSYAFIPAPSSIAAS